MSFNPFMEKAKKLESYFEPWHNLMLKPFNNYTVSIHSKVRLTLAMAMESSAIELSKAYSANCADIDTRRAMALMRRLDCHTRIKLLSLMPEQFTQAEKALISELTEITTSAICAQNEIHRQVKSSLNFILVEDFDHFYRLANLFAADKTNRHVVDEIGGWLGWKKGDIKLEVMPGRPTISQHRSAFDDVRRFIDSNKTLTQTKLNIAISGAVQSFAADFYSPLSIGILFAELASVEEQHLTHINSLADPIAPYIDRLILHKFAECYVYQSLQKEESEHTLKALYKNCLEKKIAQINYARKILNIQNRDYEEILGDANLPPPFNLEENYERNNFYIRHALKNIADNTQVAGEFLKANQLTKDYAFFKYNGTLNASVEQTASHAAVSRYINEFGEDFRIEQSPHPIAALRKRNNDNTDYAR